MPRAIPEASESGWCNYTCGDLGGAGQGSRARRPNRGGEGRGRAGVGHEVGGVHARQGVFNLLFLRALLWVRTP